MEKHNQVITCVYELEKHEAIVDEEISVVIIEYRTWKNSINNMSPCSLETRQIVHYTETNGSHRAYLSCMEHMRNMVVHLRARQRPRLFKL